jgi:hypothetical protein
VVEPDNYSPAGNFFTIFVDSAHSDYCSMKDWGGFATLHYKCWSTDYSSEENCSVPHSSFAPNL